ncbi:MAG: hypothetical protein U9M97_03230 [Candidatus Hadarchaeota archaeon]|nr:hypothetical protein [Candidatus Hadarchaeota archaeon]
MTQEKIQSLGKLPRGARIKALVDIEDVDGVVCAALIFKRFPRAIVESGSAKRRGMSGEYNVIADLPLLKSLRTHTWVDHHRNAVQEGECVEKIYDPSARSAANLLASYLGMRESELVELADRADSVSYLTEPPLGLEGDYDLAWDINDAVKAISSSEQFRELARTLAFEELAAVRKKFREELSHTRGLRRRAEDAVQMISKKMEEQGSDSLIMFMPPIERRGSTVSGHIVFFLYRRGVKAAAVFFEGGCWLTARKDFHKMNPSKIAERFGGGGHQRSAVAPIGQEKLGDIRREFEKAGLKPIVIDLRKVRWGD